MFIIIIFICFLNYGNSALQLFQQKIAIIKQLFPASIDLICCRSEDVQTETRHDVLYLNVFYCFVVRRRLNVSQLVPIGGMKHVLSGVMLRAKKSFRMQFDDVTTSSYRLI